MADGVPFAKDVIAQLFDEHGTNLLRYLTRRAGEAAQDLLSETFLGAMSSWPSFDQSRGDHRAWLYGIATNLLRRQYRQETRALAAAERFRNSGFDYQDDGFADDVSQQVDAARRVSDLAGRIAGLPPGDRDVLLLTAWSDLDSTEIAQVLGIPVGTVRSRLHRVRQQLKTNEGQL